MHILFRFGQRALISTVPVEIGKRQSDVGQALLRRTAALNVEELN